MTDLTFERIARAERAITAYDPETDTAPATIISALLDFTARTGTVPPVVTQAIVEHAAHTPRTGLNISASRPTVESAADPEEGLSTDLPADVQDELAYAHLAGAIIGSLLDEARHMPHISPMDLLSIAHHTYDTHTPTATDD